MAWNATLERQTGRLPAELTSFVGRDTELDRLRGLIGEQRLITLIGPAGVGKTRLAVRAAALVRDAGSCSSSTPANTFWTSAPSWPRRCCARPPRSVSSRPAARRWT